MSQRPEDEWQQGANLQPPARAAATCAHRLLFLGKGRLGNQIFQWLAINIQFPGCDTWAPGWAALNEVFHLPVPPHLDFDSALLDRLLRRKLGRLLMRTIFGTLRLGRYVHEPLDATGNGSGRLVHRPGWSEFVYVDGGFYQNLRDLLRPSDFQRLRLRTDLLERARKAVRQALDGQPWPQIVMHVRRTDYLQFRPYGLQDVALPAAHYLRAAQEARRELAGPQSVLVVTDDAPWCRRELSAMGEFAVINENEAVDFAILTLFPVIVIANSTFSLAAACVGPQVQRVIAPAYWFGHSVGRWLPQAIRSDDSRFIYI